MIGLWVTSTGEAGVGVQVGTDLCPALYLYVSRFLENKGVLD